MAGVSIVIPTATFTHIVASLTLPNPDGLVGEYVLGVDGTSSARNRANPAAPLTVEGAPTYTPYDVLVTGGGFGNNGFDTEFSPTGDVTMLVICKAPAEGQYIPFASYVGSTSILGFFVATDVQFGNSRWNAPPNNASLSLPGHGNHFFMAGIGALGQTPKLHLGNAGSLTNNTGAQTGISPRDTSATLHIGTVVSGRGSVAYAALYNRVLADDEVLATYLSLKSYYTGKITVA